MVLRTWIIQEVALAPRAIVVCSTHTASWDDFYRSVNYAIDLDYFSSTLPEMYSFIQNIQSARRNIARSKYSRPLDLLASFRICLGTDPRDKVFGLYSLFSLFSPSDRAAIKLQPNYRLDVYDVFTQSVIYFISPENNLEVFSFCGQDCLPVHSALPTWVPD
jgi:fructose 1,6-bisphosphatase